MPILVMLSYCNGALNQTEPKVLGSFQSSSVPVAVFLGFTSRYWVHWDAKPKRSGRDIRFYVPVEKDGTYTSLGPIGAEI